VLALALPPFWFFVGTKTGKAASGSGVALQMQIKTKDAPFTGKVKRNIPVGNKNSWSKAAAIKYHCSASLRPFGGTLAVHISDGTTPLHGR
jgi:hypothetical protein